MRTKALFFIALCCCAMSVQAQTAIKDGKQVKKILFNHEEVVIVYADGSQEASTDKAIITNEISTTGICNVSTRDGSQPRNWFTLDGRRLQSGPQQKKGIYIVKEGNQVRKTINK